MGQQHGVLPALLLCIPGVPHTCFPVLTPMRKPVHCSSLFSGLPTQLRQFGGPQPPNTYTSCRKLPKPLRLLVPSPLHEGNHPQNTHHSQNVFRTRTHPTNSRLLHLVSSLHCVLPVSPEPGLKYLLQGGWSKLHLHFGSSHYPDPQIHWINKSFGVKAISAPP